MNETDHDAAIRQAYDLWQALERATTAQGIEAARQQAMRLCRHLNNAAQHVES